MALKERSKQIAYYLSLDYPFMVKPLAKDEGGGYYVKFTDFAQASAHGDGLTIEAALQEARVSLELSIEYLLEQGIPIPKPASNDAYSGKFIVRTPKSLHRALAERAAAEEISLNQLVLTYLSAGLAKSQDGSGRN
jgi:antitoxin HicB